MPLFPTSATSFRRPSTRSNPLLWACHWAKRTAAAAALALPIFAGLGSAAAAEERSLKLFFTRTGERATITFKRNGKYDPKGLAQVNQLLRDWRRNEPAKMDPRLLDLVWEVYDRSGAKDYIHIVSAYRSPATNNMLRNRSRTTGVAKNSQHTLGKAMDFYLPGVKLATLRALAMQMQIGGVGFYPTSGSPFVHLDVGSVRAWPRMSRQELARIFPNGNTMHLPSDGRPLPGYEQAVADYRKRVGPSSIQIASTAGGDDEADGDAPRSSLLTAMLPSRTTNAERALQLQTRPQPMARSEASPFTNLASIPTPAPTMRPAPIVSEKPTETASLGNISFTGSISDQIRSFARIEFREPVGGIASLPLQPFEIDPDEEFDGTDVLTDWALSAPGSSMGMSAPLIVRRLMAAGEPVSGGAVATLPPAASDEFDTGRFWSGG